MSSANSNGAGGPRGLHIIQSRESAGRTPFPDRAAGGVALAEHLDGFRGFETLVLGLPRGGMEVAEALALRLGADLDVFVTRKIRTPGAPELAAGAVAEEGVVLWNQDVVTATALRDVDWLGEEQRTRQEVDARVSVYRSVLARAPVRGRPVLLVDDGVATGATLKAAAIAIVAMAPVALVVAVPGGSLDALKDLAEIEGVDQVLALTAPQTFQSVGELYDSFAQVTDSAVMRILRDAGERRARRSTHASL